MDLMQVHSLVNANVIVPLLEAWKEEGRIRYLGVTHHEPVYFDSMERWIEQGNLDFVQVRYSIEEVLSHPTVIENFQATEISLLISRKQN